MLIQELKNTKHMLTYYRVGKEKSLAGVLLAILNPKTNKVNFGWSKCGIDKNGKLKDNFDKTRGQFIALKRAEAKGLSNVPPEMKTLVEIFIAEAKKFFIPVPPSFVDTVSFKELNSKPSTVKTA
jgi:hypothetical protein